ncbi:MAG: cupin domain-containing protein [Ramlibacter sp.]|nr:cupin domain-containing protein [Cryobacterium sp.]
MSRPQAIATVQVENARMKVTEWRFAPGSETGSHLHTLDYLVVPQNTGQLLMETADGESVSELVAGVSYFREAGRTHNMVNPGATEFTFVEIELK